MCNTSYQIQLFGGGPLDGGFLWFPKLPEDGWEYIRESHSYTFNAGKWRMEYRGRWRHFEIGKQVVPYRNYLEALRQLGHLRLNGIISNSEHAELQARIKEELFAHGRV